MDDQDGGVDRQRDEWAADPLANYSVGPDDAGDIVMHGIGFLVNGWRRVVDLAQRFASV